MNKGKAPERLIEIINSVNTELPEVKTPEYLQGSVDYACLVIPETYEQAISSDQAKQWKAAMDTEMDMLAENDTWEVTPLPDGRTETKGKWVYTIKQGKQDSEVTYKAHYVARGYSQVHGVDYDETFSPTTRFTTIRMLLQKAVNESLHLHQMDVKGAYLNAPIDKDIYVEQPPGYEYSDESGKRLTCHLKKSLNGLKQSGRNWHHTLTDFLMSKGFIVSDTDPCVYTLDTSSGERLIILFWFDDIIIASSSTVLIEATK